jgi:hypothetical protein
VQAAAHARAESHPAACSTEALVCCCQAVGHVLANFNLGVALWLRAPFFAVPCDRFDAQHCNAKRTADGGVNHSHALELVFPEPDYANYGRAAALRKEVPPPKNDDGSFALAHFRSNLGTSLCRARNLFD